MEGLGCYSPLLLPNCSIHYLNCVAMILKVFTVKLKKYLWEHFLNNFDDSDNCTLHYLCPCSGCHQSRPPTVDLNHL